MSQAARQLIKEQYRAVYNNPFRGQTLIVDPSILRYEAARAYMRDSIRITPRSLIMPIAIVGIIVAMQMSINKERAERERKIQTGESTYFQRGLYKTKWLY